MEENESEDFLDDFEEEFEDEEEVFQPFEYSIPDDKLSKSDLLDKKLTQFLKENQANFKYLQFTVVKSANNEYTVQILHQGHGFLNYLVSKLLKIKGVEYASYIKNDLDIPKVYVHIDGSKNIKAILKEVINQMKIELKGLRNAISSAKI